MVYIYYDFKDGIKCLNKQYPDGAYDLMLLIRRLFRTVQRMQQKIIEVLVPYDLTAQ